MSLITAIETLRGLNIPVPQPLRLPTEAEVTSAEQALGIHFLPDYRYYLLHGSDVVYGTLEPAVVTPDAGHLNLLEMVRDARDSGLDSDLLPFCESNGDFYCLTPDARVVYWSHEGGNGEQWDDLAQWIERVWINGE